MENQIKVLLYHRVAEIEDDYNLLAVSRTNFENQLKYLKENYQILRLEDEWNHVTKPSVIITFDDGYEDSFQNALPILEKYQVPATFFITTGNISSDREFWHDDIIRMILTGSYYPDFFQLKHELYGQTWKTESLADRTKLYSVMRYLFQRGTDSEREDWKSQLCQWSGMGFGAREDRKSMNEEQVQLLAKSEYVSIGAHTVHHIALSKHSREIQYKEICDSKLYLEKLTGQNVKLFSYPFGGRSDYSVTTKELVMELGFQKACCVFSGEINKDTDVFQIPRELVRNWETTQFADRIEDMFSEHHIEEKESDVLEFFGRQEEDEKLYQSNRPIIIWGTGARGIHILSKMNAYKVYDNILAFGDNNTGKWGSRVEGIEVLGADEIKQRFENPIIVIASTYEREIISQLKRMQFEHLHLYL